MTTAGDIVSRTVTVMHGWSQAQDRVTPLTSDIGSADLTFTVDFPFGQANGITAGIVEIDSELLYVEAVDTTTGVCTLTKNGRGWSGTTPAAHTAGTSVASRPLYPRAKVLDEVNGVLGQLHPTLYAVKLWTGVVTFPSNTYTLPGRPSKLIDVQWKDPWGNWARARGFRFDAFDGSVRLNGAGMIGRPLRIVYAQPPDPFTSEADSMSVTGLEDEVQDVLVYGAAARLTVGLDVGRLENTSIASSDTSKVIQPGAAINVSKYLMAEYQQALAAQEQTLRAQYKPLLRKAW